MTMKQRIKDGKLFTDMCEGLPEERMQAKMKMWEFNASTPWEVDKRNALLQDIFGKPVKVWIEPPFYFCYGKNITIEDGTYLNMNCTLLDDGEIHIGKGVLFGSDITIATVAHPIDPKLRAKGYMYTAPVSIGDGCWIGSHVTICPGVTIGENTVIGAGSVVTKSLPPNIVAVGNPCRILREIGNHDAQYYYKDRKVDEDDLAQEAALHKL